MAYSLQNDIYIGSVDAPKYYYSNRSIQLNSTKGVFSVDTIGNQLSVDTFSLIVRYNAEAANLVYAPIGKDGYRDTNGKIYRLSMNGRTAAKDYLKDLWFGVPVYWYVGGNFFSKGYLKTVERVGKYAFKLTCVSGIGLLDTKYHGGGIYTGHTLLSIAQSIIGGAFPFTCDAAVGNTLVYGHLPYDTARNNLHRLLFSCGAAMTRGSADNDYVIKYLDTTTVAVPSSRIALGGSVQTQLPTNRVEITEHSYSILPTDETVTLFDNTSGQGAAENTIVTFQNPCHDLVASDNLSIVESSVNYAVVNGTGILTGKQYTHTERVITQTSGDGGEIRVKRVKDNHLVSFANSLNVAKRVLDYYKTSRVIKAKIMLQSEKTGNNLSMTDSFGDATTAFLERMNVLVTSVIGADCELVEGYTPSAQGNNYTNRVFISANGTWTVPSGIKTIRLVLVGGGAGGHGGASGGAGYGGLKSYGGDMTYYSTGGDPVYDRYYYQGGQGTSVGGNGGSGGIGGKVLVIDRNVNPGEVITFALGTGGTGGTGGSYNGTKESVDGTDGTSGTDTTASSASIGTLSSASGVDGIGYHDAFTGNDYGVTGSNGFNGGVGGQTDTDSGDSGGNGKAGASVGAYSGGNGGSGIISDTQGSLLHYWLSGAGGGGAAYGNNGSSGSSASTSAFQLYPGDGGAGANAVAPAKASYGNGGTGGHGGGGGGNGGGSSKSEYTPVSYTIYPGSGGAGGNGSSGGDGGDGCAIVLY